MGGEMKNPFGANRCEGFSELASVKYIYVMRDNIMQNFFNSPQVGAGTQKKVDLKPSIEKHPGKICTDKTGSTSNQYSFQRKFL
jgi:hypothetical protein